MNVRCELAWAFYLYEDLAYLIIYEIIGPYQNYLDWLRTPAYNWFIKIILKLRIEMEYKFAIHQNL